MAPLLNPADYAFNPSAIPVLGVMVLALLVGSAVLVRERITFVSLSFVLGVLGVSWWMLARSGMYLARDPAVALTWAHLAYLGVPCIAPATLQSTAAMLRIYGQMRGVVWLSWLLAEAFAVLGYATPVLISGVRHYEWGYYPAYGPLGLPFLGFLFAGLLGSLVQYGRALRTMPPGLHRQRTRALLVALAVGYGAVVDVPAWYGVPLYPFGYLPLAAFLLLAGGAIWRYRLVDITPAFAARQILTTMTDALLVVDPDLVVQVANPAAGALFGGAGDPAGRPLAAVLGGPPFSRDLVGGLAGSTLARYEWTYRPPAGGARYLQLAASALHDADGSLQAIVCLVRDLTDLRAATEEIHRLNLDLERRVAERTAELQRANVELAQEIAERKRMEAALQEQVAHDDLTGLPNRREFDRLLDEEIRRSQRSGRPLALVMMDLDLFKAVNDTYGHPVGDGVLRAVAARLRANIRSTDRLARYGGEELALLLPDTGAGPAHLVAEHLRHQIAVRPLAIPVDGGPPRLVPLTLSLGVAILPADSATGSGLVAAADTALYTAKTRGRNRTVCFTPDLLAPT